MAVSKDDNFIRVERGDNKFFIRYNEGGMLTDLGFHIQSSKFPGRREESSLNDARYADDNNASLAVAALKENRDEIVRLMAEQIKERIASESESFFNSSGELDIDAVETIRKGLEISRTVGPSAGRVVDAMATEAFYEAVESLDTYTPVAGHGASSVDKKGEISAADKAEILSHKGKDLAETQAILQDAGVPGKGIPADIPGGVSARFMQICGTAEVATQVIAIGQGIVGISDPAARAAEYQANADGCTPEQIEALQMAIYAYHPKGNNGDAAHWDKATVEEFNAFKETDEFKEITTAKPPVVPPVEIPEDKPAAETKTEKPAAKTQPTTPARPHDQSDPKIRALQTALIGADPAYEKKLEWTNSAGVTRVVDGVKGSRTNAVIADYATKHNLDPRDIDGITKHAKEHPYQAPAPASAPKTETEKPPVEKGNLTRDWEQNAPKPSDIPADYGGVIWETEKKTEVVREASGKPGTGGYTPAQSKSTILVQRSEGVEDIRWDLFASAPIDQDWANGLGYEWDKWPKGTPQETINKGSRGVHSFGDDGKIYLTRIDPKHGLDRYEVSQYAAEHGVNGRIELLQDDKNSVRMMNAFEGMKGMKGFDENAGIVMTMGHGVQVRVYSEGGEMRCSIVGDHTDPKVLAQAESQTPDFIKKNDRDWGDLNTAGEVAAKAVETKFSIAQPEQPAATTDAPAQDKDKAPENDASDTRGKPPVPGQTN